MSKKSKMANIELKISQEPNSPVMKLIKQTGIEGIALDVIKAIMSPLINLIANRDGDDVGSALNKSITLIAASDPKNQSELMLATQLAMTHITLGKSARLLDQNYSDVQTINSLGNLYTKLSRLGIEQINTLERMKGKGQQRIIVEKINIEAGGQAAIGVYEGVGVNAKKGL
ncbi:MAG: hypothetical protein MUR24_04340 [Oceanospirillaceae bacterium]|mgnify:FL=1|nr:hypothetical protein [Oceanospirillaceae bacterium]|tara:strand:+ start:205 stop:720 length:516 start_codon:yes stop_codon:yes gene_type:complete